MKRIRLFLLRWLGIDAKLARLLELERERNQRELGDFALNVAGTTEKLAGALRLAVGQLNVNTTTVQRWAHEHETLRHIEERHARKTKAGIELVHGDGASRIVGLDSA